MDKNQLQSIASEHKLGKIHFQFNVARNTGKEFEVGYVFIGSTRELFCKRQPGDAADAFYLCNEFGALQ